MKLKRIGLLALLFLFSVGLTSPAYANLNIKPTDSKEDLYRVQMKPGESRNFRFTIFNDGDKLATGTLYPSDQLTAPNGGARYSDVGGELILNGTWATMLTKDITLKAGSSQKVTYKVTVPEDTKDGQYILAIVTKETGTQIISAKGIVDGKEVGIFGYPDMEIGKQIVVEVNPGNSTRSLKINDEFLFEGATAEFSFLNDGTILLHPKVSLTILKDGSAIYSPTVLDSGLSWYQGTTIPISLNVEKRPEVGSYIARVTATDGDLTVTKDFNFHIEAAKTSTITQKRTELTEALNSKVFDKNGEITTGDVVIVMGTFLILLLLILIFLLLRKKKKRDEDESPQDD